jgi:integrase
MDKRVATRIRRRLRAARKTESGLIFPRPSSDTPWDPRGAQKAVRALYDEMADALGIPLLREVSTHVWRATLNSEWSDLGVSAERRAAYFGHTPEVNRQSYTDLVDLSELEARVSGSM